MFRAGIAGPAAREAYLAALIAARAFIFEQREMTSKTHSGTHALFSELAVRTRLVHADIVDILNRGFRVKTEVDYEPVEPPNASIARKILDQAHHFLAEVKRLVEATKPPT